MDILDHSEGGKNLGDLSTERTVSSFGGRGGEMGSRPAEVGFSPVLSPESSSTNKENGAPRTGRPAGGTGGELDSRRTGMGGATGGSIWGESGHLLPISWTKLPLSPGCTGEVLCFFFTPKKKTIFFCIAEPRGLFMIKAENVSSWLLPLGYSKM